MIHAILISRGRRETSASRLQLDGGGFEYLIFVSRAFSPTAEHARLEPEFRNVTRLVFAPAVRCSLTTRREK